ncbi:MAG TPA: DUF3352 domain-containing protein [Chloroflexota bacterium]|jgi:hypothetical protein
MTRRRLFAVLLVLSLALVPLRAAAQAPPPAPGALAALFPADTVVYAEMQLRPGGDQQPRLERLLGTLLDLAPDEEQMAWVRLVPRVASAFALGVWPQGDSIGVVGAIAADDPGALLSLILAAHKDAANGEPYGDVTIQTLGDSHSLYAAAVGRYLLAAMDRDALTATIDRVRAGAGASGGLGGTSNYQAAVGRLPASRFATAYLDGPSLARWLDARMAEADAGTPGSTGATVTPGLAPGALPAEALPPGLPSATGPSGTPERPASRSVTPGVVPLSSLASVFAMGSAFTHGLSSAGGDASSGLDALRAGSLAFAATAAPEGLRLVVEAPAAMERTPRSASTGEALHFVPQNALFAAAGHDLASQLRPALADLPPGTLDQLPGGIDLQADVLDWLDGEYGIALMPPRPDSATGAFPEITLLFEVRDPPTVEGKLRKLVQAIPADANVPREPIEDREGDVQVRRLPIGDRLALTWGYIGRWLFLTTGTSAPLVQASAAGGLPASPAYAHVASTLPSPNSGVLYANLPAFIDWLGAFTDGRFPPGGDDGARWRDLLGLLGTAAAGNGLARDGWLETVAVLEVRW